jgi:hypothetical protein
MTEGKCQEFLEQKFLFLAEDFCWVCGKMATRYSIELLHHLRWCPRNFLWLALQPAAAKPATK